MSDRYIGQTKTAAGVIFHYADSDKSSAVESVYYSDEALKQLSEKS